MGGTLAKKKAGKNLTEGPIFGLLMSFAIPIILASLVQQLYSVVDMMIMGKFVGSIGSVGVSTGGEVADLMIPFSTSLAMGGQVLIAQLMGMKDDDRIKKTIGTMLTIMMSLSVVFMLIPIIFCNPILKALNCPEEAFGQARSYMIITSLGIPFIFGYNGVCGVLRGMGESKKPLTFVLWSSAIHIVVALVFVGVFHMEAAGVALATSLSQLLSFILAFAFMYKRRDEFGFELKRSYFKVDKELAVAMLKISIPQLIRNFVIHFVLIYVKSCVNAYGLVVSATYSVGNKIEKFMNVFSSGVDTACGAMMGQNLGARKLDRVKKTMWTTLAVTLVIGAVCAAVFLAIPTQLYGLFSDDAEVIAYGVTFLRIMAVGCLVHGYAGAFKSIGVGAGSPSMIFVLAILDPVCRLTVIFLGLKVFNLGSDSYFWGAALCQFFPGVAGMIYFLSNKWEKKKLLVSEKK